MDRLKAEVVTIADNAAALAVSASGAQQLSAATKVTSRLNDGQVFYLNKQYSRAAIVLMDLAERPGIKSHPAYSDVIYYLADSLFQMGNDKSAAIYLKILDRKAGKDRREWALGRLLQICARRTDVGFCDENRRRAFSQVNQSSLPSLKYALGKALYRNESFDDAKRVFGLIRLKESEWAKAAYFIGVVDVRRAELDSARKQFEKVVKRYSGIPRVELSDEEYQVKNLARLAVARILYEQSKLPESRDHYNQVDTASKAYDEAHYESIWLSIKEKNYEKSLRDLELFMINQDDITRGYKAHLLKGRLLILLERFKEAQSSFGQVTDTFLPIRNELERTLKAHPDLEAHFQREVGQNITDIDMSSLVPKAAADAVGSELNTDEAVVLVQEVSTQRRDVEAARRTVAKLRTALSNEMRLEMFPELQTGYLGAIELLNRALIAESDLNHKIGDSVTNAAYREARARRDTLRKQFRQVPVTAIEFKTRRRQMTEKLRQLDMVVNKLNVELTTVDAQLVAIKRFQENGDRAKNGRAVESEFERARILRKELQQLVWSLEDERTKLGADDNAARQDARIRDRFRKALVSETRLLRQLRPRHIDLRESLSKSTRQLDVYLGDLRLKVSRMVSEIRAEVEVESKKLDTFERELRVREKDTSRLGGAIAAATFRRVYRSIRQVVLEADVGLVNMAWKRKQDRTTSIRRMQERKNEDIGRVEEVFSEVTGE